MVSNKPDIILICGNMDQAGLLQTQIIRASLDKYKARPKGDGSGQWLLPNGTIIQFAVLDTDVHTVLQQAERAAQVFLLLKQDDVSPEMSWYFSTFFQQLSHLQETRDIRVTFIQEHYPQLGQPFGSLLLNGPQQALSLPKDISVEDYDTLPLIEVLRD